MAIQESESYTEDQIFAILRRINYPLKNSVLPEPTLDTLRELQYRCVTSIPFETLSLRLTKARSVDISAQGVFDRVVNQRRGGWCFSLNRLAYELLKGLGYTVQYTLARVCKPTESDPFGAGGLTHRLSIVRFADGSKYTFDIGFGNTHFYPIELRNNAEIEFFGHKRRLNRTLQHPDASPAFLGQPAEPLWCMEEYMGLDEQGVVEKWVPRYLFSEQQYYEPDCVIANFYCAYGPTSPFLGLFRAVQGTLDGKYYILLNTEFKIRSATGTDSLEIITTEQRRLDILKKYFDIVLTEEEWVHHDQKIES